MVKDFKRFYRKERDPAMKVELVLSLQGVEDPSVASVMLPILTDRDPALAEAALRVVAGLAEPESRVPLAKVLEDGKPKDAIAPIARAAGDGRWAEFGALLMPYLEDGDDAVRLWAVRALGAIGPPGALEAVAPMATGDPNPMVRVAAVEALQALGKGHEDVAGPPLVAALEDADVSVAVAAARALHVVRVKEAVPVLIGILEAGEAGKLLEEVWPTLVALTDAPYNDDPGIWRRWWERVGSQPDYRLPTDEEIAARREAREKANAQYHTPKTEAAFMGVPTASRNIVFVIDVSGSMEELVVDRDAFRQRGFTSFHKLDIVKEELIRSIEGLGPEVRFNVYAFASKVHPWKKGLVPATALSKKSAIAWVKKLKPIGGGQAAARASAGLRGSSGLEDGRTNTHAALLAGLGVPLDPRKRASVTESAADPPEGMGDTMFFLSDGKPTVGELVDTEDILQAVADLNRFRKVTIHTIAIGDFTSSFLKKLAEQNGGVFVDLGK